MRHLRPAKDRPFTLRDLARDELQILKRPRTVVSNPQKLRESHHMVARLAAMGMRNYEIEAQTGYATTRISTLLNSPAMKELIARYREKVDEAFVSEAETFVALATSNMVAAERQIKDKLDQADEEGEMLPTRELLAISRDAADRLGYGKKNTTVNVNVDFAAQLEKAIKRSGIDPRPEPKLVRDARQPVLPTPPPRQKLVERPLHSISPAPLLRRAFA